MPQKEPAKGQLPQGMKDHRYLYSAKAVALAANISGPDILSRVWAATSLPLIGGTHSATEGSFAHPVLSFASASATVYGWEKPTAEGIDYVTEAWVTVTGLNILNIVTGSIEVGMVTTYHYNETTKKGDYEVAFTPDRPYSGINIAGVTAPIHAVGFEKSLARRPKAPDFKKLMLEIPSKRPQRFSVHDTEVSSLVDNANQFQWQGQPQNRFAFLTVPKLGRVYFGGWSVEPARQCLSMLIVALDDPAHGYTGQIVIIDPDENGIPMPGGY